MQTIFINADQTNSEVEEITKMEEFIDQYFHGDGPRHRHPTTPVLILTANSDLVLVFE